MGSEQEPFGRLVSFDVSTDSACDIRLARCRFSSANVPLGGCGAELPFGETAFAFELPVASGEVRVWRSSPEFDSGRPFDEEGLIAEFPDAGTSELFATPSFGACTLELTGSVAALLASRADEEELVACLVVLSGGSQMSFSLRRCFDVFCVPFALRFTPALSLTLLDMIGFTSFSSFDGSGFWSPDVMITVGTTSLTLMVSPVFD